VALAPLARVAAVWRVPLRRGHPRRPLPLRRNDDLRLRDVPVVGLRHEAGGPPPGSLRVVERQRSPQLRRAEHPTRARHTPQGVQSRRDDLGFHHRGHPRRCLRRLAEAQQAVARNHPRVLTFIRNVLVAGLPRVRRHDDPPAPGPWPRHLTRSPRCALAAQAD
jgi:hypothetical protein